MTCRPSSTSSLVCGCITSPPARPAPFPKRRSPRWSRSSPTGCSSGWASAGTFGEGDVPYDAVHANYWLSGVAGHMIKHQMNLPLVSTFHTLDRVKAEFSPEEVEADSHHQRAEAEATIIRCSDTVLASCSVEAAQITELYHADPSRIRIVAPGVDHAFFGPGERRQARRALGLAEEGPLLLFVGRVQPLKGAGVAVRTLAQLRSRSPRCPSGNRRRAERSPGGGRNGAVGRSGR